MGNKGRSTFETFEDPFPSPPGLLRTKLMRRRDEVSFALSPAVSLDVSEAGPGADRPRRRAAMRPSFALLLLLTAYVVLSELVAVRYWVGTCGWPSLAGGDGGRGAAGEEEGAHRVSRLLVIADPQLTDEVSYEIGRGPLLGLVEWLSDLYMQRVYGLARRRLDPDHVVVLGDMFDGGHLWDDEAYAAEMARYVRIFGREVYDRDRVWHVVGNHDVGYAANMDPARLRRYEATFGAANFRRSLAAWNLLGVNSEALARTRSRRISDETWQFIDQQAAGGLDPAILLLHIPLSREHASTECGPLRTFGPLEQYVVWGGETADVIYQNLVQEADSKRLLDAVRPKLVLSAHDHDQCSYVHADGTLEVTIGSISFLQGNYYPSFALLTLFTHNGEPEYDLQLCFLPVQWRYYIAHGIVLLIAAAARVPHYARMPVSAALRRMPKATCARIGATALLDALAHLLPLLLLAMAYDSRPWLPQ